MQRVKEDIKSDGVWCRANREWRVGTQKDIHSMTREIDEQPTQNSQG